MPCATQVVGVQLLLPHWFGPLPPQIWPGVVQGPQSSEPPQPFGIIPQSACFAAQDVGVQGGVTH